MIVGNKAKFAIELLFDEFYDNNFIASGAYRIFLNGFPYGYEEPYSTLSSIFLFTYGCFIIVFDIGYVLGFILIISLKKLCKKII